jgi:hypothetical protein
MGKYGYKELEKSSLYEGVTKVRTASSRDTISDANKAHEIRWKGRVIVNKMYYAAFFDTEKEAALWVDKKLISLGKSPKNILKKNE